MLNKIEHFPTEYTDNLQELYYHNKCYRYFTDITKIERAKKTALGRKTSTKISSESAKRRSLRRLSAPIISNSSTTKSSSALPEICIICSKKECYVIDPHDKKRKQQGLTLSETIDGGLIRKAAEVKNDEKVLTQISDKDFVAIEVRYHRKCYNSYTKCVKNLREQQASSSSVSVSISYELSFQHFCKSIIENELIAMGKVYI